MRFTSLVRVFISLSVSFIVSVSLGSKAYAEEKPQVWRFGLEEIEGSVQHIYAEEFKKRIEEKTHGGVIVDIYPYGLLGESEDLTTLTELGTLQLTHASMGIVGERFPLMQVFNIPYLFGEDDDINQRILASTPEIYDIIGNSLIKHNLRLLTLYLEGDMVWSTNTAIKQPSDFIDFKMRTMNAALVAAIFEQYGATAVPLPYSKVYGALQSNLVDGQSNPIFAIEEMKFYEVTDYLIWSGQRKFITSILANQAWYLALDQNTKQTLNDTLAEMAPFILTQQKQLNQDRLETIRTFKPDMVMIQLTERQRANFRQHSDAISRLYIEQSGTAGKRLLDAINEAKPQS